MVTENPAFKHAEATLVDLKNFSDMMSMSTSPQDGRSGVSPPVAMGVPPGMPHPMFPSHPSINPMVMFPNPAHFAMSQMMTPHTQIDFLHPKSVTFECCLPNCEKTFTKTRHLYKHLKHDHHTKFICPYCEKKSNCMANFVSHCRTHTNEKPWPCPLPTCTYRGRNKNHSKCHVIQNHGVEILQNFESFFMQDRLSVSSNRKRAAGKAFGAPKSLMKRQRMHPFLTHMPGQVPPMANLPPMVASRAMNMQDPAAVALAQMTHQQAQQSPVIVPHSAILR